MTVTTLAGLRDLVGAPLGTSAWHAVDQDAIDVFARVTDDEQWIHVDRDRAADGPFGTTIAHGYLTLSLCSSFLAQALRVQDAALAINYGLDRVRFPAPVPSGARVRGTAELRSLDDVPHGVQAVVRVVVEVEGAAKPACIADLVIRYLEEPRR